jgi:hypothetical protein
MLAGSLRQRGLRGTARRTTEYLRIWRTERRRLRTDREYDAELHVDTAEWVLVPDLHVDGPNVEYATRYQPTSVADFKLLIDRLPIEHSEFAFVDYGSGKGRALLLAAQYPFKRIVGVEFSAELDAIARGNIAALGEEDAKRVQTYVLDAALFDPPAEPLVLYFYNPFESPVLRSVLERVRASLAASPRPAYIVLIGPAVLAEVVEESGFEPVLVTPKEHDVAGIWTGRG